MEKFSILIREAFKKKVWNFPYLGGLTDKIPYFLKLCLKSILGHSESFWQKKFWVKKVGGVPYLAIFCRFLDFENFYKCLTFLGAKNTFFQKVPQ